GKMACLGQDFAALRHAVTSKRGTTERAIAVMEQRQMKAIVNDAMQAAFSRAKEIADKLDADE
ncbi:MAG: pyrroline-5-carboxylate reductase family protein, partial [Gammaproteobacteria bacterium]